MLWVWYVPFILLNSYCSKYLLILSLETPHWHSLYVFIHTEETLSYLLLALKNILMESSV